MTTPMVIRFDEERNRAARLGRYPSLSAARRTLRLVATLTPCRLCNARSTVPREMPKESAISWTPIWLESVVDSRLDREFLSSLVQSGKGVSKNHLKRRKGISQPQKVKRSLWKSVRKSHDGLRVAFLCDFFLDNGKRVAITCTRT